MGMFVPACMDWPAIHANDLRPFVAPSFLLCIHQVLMHQSSDSSKTALALSQHIAFHSPFGVKHYIMYMTHSIQQLLNQPGIKVSPLAPQEGIPQQFIHFSGFCRDIGEGETMQQ